MRLYIDTSVLGGLTDRDDTRRLAVTRRLLKAIAAGKHEGIISNVVIEELEKAPELVRHDIRQGVRSVEFEVVGENDESRALFLEYTATRVVPLRFRNDLRHVAIAAVGRADALVSWNFRHLVNVRTRRVVHSVNLRLGYPLLEIVSPEEV